MSDIGENDLREAARQGSVIRARDDDGRGRIHASVIRAHCRNSAHETDPRGLRIEGAVLTGGLDLSAMRLVFPLSFDDCEFEQALHLDGAELHSLRIHDCVLPGLLANGVNVRRDLDLSQWLRHRRRNGPFHR